MKKVFERAKNGLNDKKVYLALLGMYERTEQRKLAEELLEKMTKIYKQSCKVLHEFLLLVSLLLDNPAHNLVNIGLAETDTDSLEAKIGG